MPNVTMTLEEYEALRRLISSERESEGAIEQKKATKKPRKASAYNKRYGKHFNAVEHKYKKKNGGWIKNGFKRAQKEAHALTRGEK